MNILRSNLLILVGPVAYLDRGGGNSKIYLNFGGVIFLININVLKIQTFVNRVNYGVLNISL